MEKNEQLPISPASLSLPSNTKILRAVRVVNEISYDFTLTVGLNYESPWNTKLHVHCVSEYFDEYTLSTTAKEVQERLIQLYSFDRENYIRSTQYVIRHSLKVLTITTDSNELTLIDSPLNPSLSSDHPDHVIRGATVMQARARGMLQRKKDKLHGVVTVDFSSGTLGIELEDRPGKYGAVIYDFTKDENGDNMAAENSKLLDRGMVVLRVNDREAIGEPFQQVLSMIRQCPRPMTMQFAYSYSKILQLADNHWKIKKGPRPKRKKSIKKDEEDDGTPKPLIKILKGSRVIHDETYDFTCTCELNIDSPLDTILTIECVSEYYDNKNNLPLIITAKDAQDRLIKMYPFDELNYMNNTKYVIHHTLKVLDIDSDTQTLVLIDPLKINKKLKHTLIKNEKGDVIENDDGHSSGKGMITEDENEEDKQNIIQKNRMNVDEEKGMLIEQENEGLEEEVNRSKTATTKQMVQQQPSGPFWQSWVPEHLVKGATVIQSRARGMIQRIKDDKHGIVNVEFSNGLLGLELGKFI